MTVAKLRNYVGGKWLDPENHGFLDVEQPSTAEVIAQVPLSTAAETERAVNAAAKAFHHWSHVPVARRCELLWQLSNRIRDNANDLAHLISRENGKSLPDAFHHPGTELLNEYVRFLSQLVNNFPSGI